MKHTCITDDGGTPGRKCAACEAEKVAVQHQPAPRRTDAPSAHDLVSADMQTRKAMGLKKYNTILQAGNGRDSLVDAYQESLDLVAYLRNEIEERRDLRAEITRLRQRLLDAGLSPD